MLSFLNGLIGEAEEKRLS